VQTTPTASSRTANILFACGLLIFAIWLITQIGDEAKFSTKGKLFAQPAFWPAISLAGMVMFAVLHLCQLLRSRHHDGPSESESFTTASPGSRSRAWLGVFEFYLYFMAYVWAVPVLGYLLATIIFTTLLVLRTGYRSKKMLGLAAASGVAIVLLFKTFLSVKIPGATWYSTLPDRLSNFMIINF